MNITIKILLASIVGACLSASANGLGSGCAAAGPQQSREIVIEDTTVVEPLPATPDIVPHKRRLAFAWGADLAGNVDLSSHDMSSVGLSAEFGLRWRWIRFLGVGAAGNIMVDNSNRSFPIFLNFRTDFSNHRRLVFMDIRGGVALNYFNGDEHETGAYASGGIGVTLAAGRTFSSHIILAYTYISQDKCYNGKYLRDCPGISMATLRLGVAF